MRQRDSERTGVYKNKFMGISKTLSSRKQTRKVDQYVYSGASTLGCTNL